MHYCYSLLVVETKFQASAHVVATTEDVLRSHESTMPLADAEVAGGVKKLYDVELSPVVIDGKTVDGFWRGSLKMMEREINVWVTRMKQIVRIG